MFMVALLGVKQILAKRSVDELADLSQSPFRIGQQIFIAKEPVVGQMLKPAMNSRCPAVVSDHKPNHDFSDQPGQPRMLENS